MSALILMLPGKKAPTFYLLERIEPDPEIAVKAWRLRKLASDNEVYNVSITDNGISSCTCAGAVYRPKLNSVCKHAKGLREKGLL